MTVSFIGNVGHAREAEKAVADFYATGPIYELSAGVLGQLFEKGAELLSAAVEARQAAATATEIAADARRLAQEGCQFGKSAKDIEELEQETAEAD